MDNANNDGQSSFIPASQRPDGTWRKARRVKEGYVPQEEVPLYESKGKKFMNKQMQPADPVKVDGYTSHKTIPGLFIEEKPAKKEGKKKAAKTEQLTNELSKLNVTNGVDKVDNSSRSEVGAALDPAKKLKNLKKRLREVEALEEKIKSGALLKPEPDQLAKVTRKNDLIYEIHQLEKMQ